MQPQTPPTPLAVDSASDSNNMRKLALDWVDALGILALMYALAFVIHFFELGEIPRAVVGVVVVGFPLARRRWLGTPVRTVSRSFSLLGLLSTALIIFGTLGGGFVAFAALVAAGKMQERPAVEAPFVGLHVVPPEGALTEVYAGSEEENPLDQERVQRELRALRESEERWAREARAYKEESQRKRTRDLLVFGGVTVGMVVLGGLLDRLRMRRDAAAELDTA